MAINFKKITPKFSMVPLILIVFSGINNNIKAMDDNYGQENTININNNVTNRNKLKEYVDFSEFQTFIRSFDDYHYREENYTKCVGFFKLLPQFIKNDTNSISFNDRYRKFANDLKNELIELKNSKSYEKKNYAKIAPQARIIIRKFGRQFGINMQRLIDKTENGGICHLIDGIISYDFGNYNEADCFSYCSNEICLNYLLDYSCFVQFFSNVWKATSAYKNFLKTLRKYYSENCNKNEYTKILRIMLNNCLMYVFRANPNFVEIAERIYCKKFDEHFNYLFYDYKKNPYSIDCDDKPYIYGIVFNDRYNENKDICDEILGNIIPLIIGELARVEYNNYPNISMPVTTISDKIMNESIMPCIKKCILRLCDSLSLRYKDEILKQNQIVLKLGKSENKADQDKVQKAQETIKKLCNVLQNEMPELTKYLDNKLNNERIITHFKQILEVSDIVHIATKYLRKEETINTFKRKFVNNNGDQKIKSKYIIKNINDYANNHIIKLMKYTRPVDGKK